MRASWLLLSTILAQPTLAATRCQQRYNLVCALWVTRCVTPSLTLPCVTQQELEDFFTDEEVRASQLFWPDPAKLMPEGHHSYDIHESPEYRSMFALNADLSAKEKLGLRQHKSFRTLDTSVRTPDVRRQQLLRPPPPLLSCLWTDSRARVCVCVCVFLRASPHTISKSRSRLLCEMQLGVWTSRMCLPRQCSGAPQGACWEAWRTSLARALCASCHPARTSMARP